MIKFLLVIDYANLYKSYEVLYGLKNYIEIQEKIAETVTNLEVLMGKSFGYDEFEFNKKAAIVLKQFSDPTQILNKVGVEVILVEDNSKKLKGVNSRRDDKVLSRFAIDNLEHNDAVFIISNDGGFCSTVAQLQRKGIYVWCGTISTKKSIRPNSKIFEYCDKVVSLNNLFKGKEQISKINQRYILTNNKINFQGKRIEVFNKKRDLVAIFNLDGFKRKIIVGRSSVTKGVIPDIDLSKFDIKKNVSRQHLTILPNKDTLSLEIHKNCNSITLVNGEIIEGRTRKKIFPGDLIVVGNEKDFSLKFVI